MSQQTPWQSQRRGGLQGVKLSKKEARELEYKRRVYELAKQRKATEDALQQRDEYHLPDSYEAEGQRSQRYEVLTARYRWVPEGAFSLVAKRP